MTQCARIGCVRETTEGRKYCSEECAPYSLVPDTRRAKKTYRFNLTTEEQLELNQVFDEADRLTEEYTMKIAALSMRPSVSRYNKVLAEHLGLPSRQLARWQRTYRGMLQRKRVQSEQENKKQDE